MSTVAIAATSAPTLNQTEPIPMPRPRLYMQWERVNGQLQAKWLQQPD